MIHNTTRIAVQSATVLALAAMCIGCAGNNSGKNRESKTILIDEAHNNLHTAEGRYRPFAEALREAGYRVEPSRSEFSSEALSDADVLVVSNALNERNLGNWRLPTPSAFSEEEIAALRSWVESGGRLLLIADHMPFPGAAEELAASFGVRFGNGFALDTHLVNRQPHLAFSRADETLASHAITGGREGYRPIDSVSTFAGQAFESDSLEPLLTFGPGTVMLLPEVAWQFDSATRTVPIEGWMQGGVRNVGAGRIAVFGEAAMFTRQETDGEAFGMETRFAPQNRSFLLNVMRWLTE